MQHNHASSRKNSLIKVVEEVAFQANLLALHASVAMAGSHSVSEFAVAADEVRHLAHQGAQAVKASSLVEQEQIF
jgi:methyl-accepting chemotaxis protein